LNFRVFFYYYCLIASKNPKVFQCPPGLYGGLFIVTNRYGVPTQTIVELNGLASTSSLVPGLALYIPDNQLPIRSYQIKPGDHIWKLAPQFNTDISTILGTNPGVDPNQLFIGQIITIACNV
jgi:spore germination protein